MNTEKIASALVEGIPNGGATINKHGNPVKKGLAVGIDVIQTKLDIGAAIDNKYAYRQVKSWLDGLVEHYPNKIDFDGLAFGVWKQGYVVYLDIVRVYPEKEIVQAVKKARECEQQAIQLLDPNVTLHLSFIGY